MSIERLVGVVAGAVVGIVLVAIVLKLTKTNSSNKCEYDERQQIVRGKGYQYGFFTMMIVNMLAILVNLAEVPVPIETSVIHFFSILAGVGVYASYCILKDGYFALNENKKAVLFLFGVIAAMNVASGIAGIVDGSMMTNGMVSYRCINLLCGGLFGVIFIMLLIKSVLQKREDKGI